MEIHYPDNTQNDELFSERLQKEIKDHYIVFELKQKSNSKNVLKLFGSKLCCIHFENDSFEMINHDVLNYMKPILEKYLTLHKFNENEVIHK